MKSKYADFGWEIDMTLLRAIRVIYWRAVKHETWRGIAFLWNKKYPEYEGFDIDSNQLYGMSVVDCAANKIKIGSYGSSFLN